MYETSTILLQWERRRDTFHFPHSPCIPDLVANGTVVIGVHYGDFHRRPGHVQAIAGRDVEQIPVLLLTVQQATHINLPLSLHQGQAEHAPRISPWRAHADTAEMTTMTTMTITQTSTCKSIGESCLFTSYK